MDPLRARKGRTGAKSTPGCLTPKILYYTDARTSGGAERVLSTVLQNLDGATWQRVVVLHSSAGLESLASELNAAGIRTVPLTWPTGKLDRLLEMLPTLTRTFLRERPDIVHFNLAWPLACRYGLIAARWTHAPHVVATLHSSMRLARSAATLQRLALSHVDRFIAVSDYVARGLREQLKIPGVRIRVVRNAVPNVEASRDRAAALRHMLQQGRDLPIVLTVARLDRGKGHQYLLHAATRIPRALFVIAGAGPQETELATLARRLGVADRTVFLGARDDVPDVLAACDLVVLPSLNEGLPLTLLEAMAAQKPIVATNIGGIPEVVVDGQTGLLVAPADADDLARGIRALLEDATLAARLGAAGQARCEREFTVSRMVSGVAGVYAEVLDSATLVPRAI